MRIRFRHRSTHPGKRLKCFCPPKPNQLAITIAKAVSPLLLRSIYRCKGVNYDFAQLRGFESLKNSRVLLVSNHPTKADPVLAFSLAAKFRDIPYMVSNREQFDRLKGFYGSVLQRIGCFSVARGTNDKRYFMQALKLWQEDNNLVAIFPEGGTYCRSDRALRFQDSVFKLYATAYIKTKERDPDAKFYIQPVAIKYVCVPNPKAHAQFHEQVRDALHRLEESLELQYDASLSDVARLKCIGLAMLSSAESQRSIHSDENASIHERLHILKEKLLGDVAHLLGMDCEELNKLPFHQKFRRVFESFHKIDLMEIGELNSYENYMLYQEQRLLKLIRSELFRLETWLDVEPNYLEEHPSYERIADTIVRMEREVFGKVYFKTWTEAVVRLAPVIDLDDYINIQALDKSAGEMARLAESRIQKIFESIQESERSFFCDARHKK